MVAAKASIADRVVPEEQFYDQAAEQEFSGEKSANDATRSTRADATNTNSGSIGSLLTSLVTNIGNEQTACDTQYAADSRVCVGTHAAVRVPAPLLL